MLIIDQIWQSGKITLWSRILQKPLYMFPNLYLRKLWMFRHDCMWLCSRLINLQLRNPYLQRSKTFSRSYHLCRWISYAQHCPNNVRGDRTVNVSQAPMMREGREAWLFLLGLISQKEDPISMVEVMMHTQLKLEWPETVLHTYHIASYQCL